MLIPPKYDTRYHRVEPIPISCKIRCNKWLEVHDGLQKGEYRHWVCAKVPKIQLVLESGKLKGPNRCWVQCWGKTRWNLTARMVCSLHLVRYDYRYLHGLQKVGPTATFAIRISWYYQQPPTVTNNHQQPPTTTNNHQQQIWQLEFLVQNASVFPDVPEDKSTWRRLVNWDHHPSSGDKTQHKSLLTNMISRFWLYKCVCVYMYNARYIYIYMYVCV